MDTRVLPDGGELIYDPRSIVAVGDRGIPRSVLYRHPGGENEPAFEVKIEVWDGVPVCTEVNVMAKPDDRIHIRAKDLKFVAFQLENSVRYWLSELAYEPTYTRGGRRGWRRGFPVSAADRIAAGKSVERARRQVRRKSTADHLQTVAETYRSATTAPVDAVASAFGVDYRTAQRYVAKARDARLLPPATRSGKKQP